MEVLKPYREKIDKIDRQLVELLVQRYEVIDQVCEVKKREAIPAVLQDRIEEVLDHVADHAHGKGLNEVLIRNLWRQLIEDACQRETQFLKEDLPE